MYQTTCSCLNTCLGSVRTKTLVTRLSFVKEHGTDLNAGPLQILQCAVNPCMPNGGASRDRTDDPLLAKQVLSQLSYGPVVGGSGRTRTTGLTLIRGAL